MATVKVDNNRGAGSFGSKRSRNDAREGDWKCPKCGNVNFSFRAVCNRGTCGAPRPSASPSPRMVPPTLGGGYEHRPSPYYGGAPPPPYGPPPPVGMSGSYGPSPYQHLSMRYGYGPPYGSSGSYPPYSSYHSPGPMGGIGYGPGADMGRYGYGYRGSPMPGPNPWPTGALPDNNDNSASRKRRGGPDGSPSEGDWKCPKCENVNFAFRTTCNMKKCGAPRPSYPAPMTANGGSGGKKEQGEAPEGSWTCGKCSNLNYPFRTVCNRKGCGNERPAADTTAN